MTSQPAATLQSVKPPKFTAKKWLKVFAGLLAGLLVLWALAYALVPVIAKSQIQKIASDKLGRQVTVGSIDFKPWSLELAINDLQVAKTNPATAQLSIKRIFIDAELESLLRLAPIVDAIAVDTPVVALTHLGGGRYDIDDIFAKLKPAPDAPPGEPMQFALYNLSLSGGRVDFTDQAVGKTHSLSALVVSVPFLSNLESKREVKTAPRLAFKLAGSSFDSAAEGTPFAQTRKTDGVIKLANFDLAPYLAYLPAGLSYKLTGAVLNLDAKVAFEQNPTAAVKVSGVVAIGNVVVQPAQGGQLLAFEQLRVTMDDVRPLAQSVKLAKVELNVPVLNVARNKSGQLNLPPAANQNAIKSGAASAQGNSGTASKDSKNAVQTKQSAWRVEVASVAVRGGRVAWLDETLASPARVDLTSVTLDASKIAYPFAASAPLAFNGSMALNTTATKAITVPGSINFSGTATDIAANVSATVADWPLTMAAKYIGQFLLPALGGQLNAQLGINWRAATPLEPQQLGITGTQAALTDVLLAEGKTSLVSIKRVQLDGIDIDVHGQSFKAAKVQVLQPKALVDRDANKRWMYESWLIENKAAAKTATNTPAPPPTSDATKANAPTWAVAVANASVVGGAMSFTDKAGSKPVAFDVSGFNAQLADLVLDDKSAAKIKTTAAQKPMPLTVAMTLKAGQFEPGKLNFKGALAIAPELQAQGQLLIERLPVQAFEPYFADALNIELLRADASFKGKVAYRQSAAGPVATVAGDVQLEELKANTLAPSEELLAWKALSLRGLAVAIEPAKPAKIDVAETILADFFARLIVMPDGRINLQDLLKASSASATNTSATNTSATNTIAASAQETSGTALKTTTNPTSTVAVAPQTAQTSTAIINFGPVSLVNGRVAFSDRFVKPNYSANLSDLTGKLSAFSSVASGATPTLADLELRGRAEGTASLEILGKLNPLATPLALDITGKVRDLELPPLSPYSVKYAGYGITRGKMSVDVSYLVQPDGNLTAKNKLVLNQLSFGDKVEGSTASLPVKLAVALLSDRNGVIDLDLPISGSLNDPQFSIGPIIIKVIINVIVKAITAPFSLLASAFGGGGGDELSTVAFASGSAGLSDTAKAGLDKVAKALIDRPSLRLTVVGTSSIEAERDGYQRARLDELVRSEKRRSTVKDGGTSTVAITFTPAEYPALLKEVYKRADITKPRSVIGLAKDLPVDDMEKLLLADIKVNDDSMQALALQRGVAVKEYLASKELPLDRLFLGATKSEKAGAVGAKADPKPDAKWTPRAELNIAMP
jgi:Domain of Unknown Function (DUF748)